MISKMARLLPSLKSFRNRHFFLLDVILLILTPWLALAMRTDGISMQRYSAALLIYGLITVSIRVLVFYRLGLYSRYWRFASVDELAEITLAVISSTGLVVLFLLILFFLAPMWPLLNQVLTFVFAGFPRSLPFIDGLLALIAVGGSRFGIRLLEQWQRQQQHSENAKRVIIIGAGQAGAMIARELRSASSVSMEAVGFIDDDFAKHDVMIHGVPVLGGRRSIPNVARDYKVQLAIIAMPTASGKAIREIVSICEQARVPTQIIPSINELLNANVSLNQLRNVQIEDLLRRVPVETDTAVVQSLLRGKRILVTGGGGSIGGELCRQILRCEPSELIVLGHGENSIFEIYHELLHVATLMASPTKIYPVIAGIRFSDRIQQVFESHRPHIVFHAAAHKHVPLMELNPVEAITNNVMGTRLLLEAAQSVGVDHFVMISTDKAVNPTSVMGASKRVAELLVHRAATISKKPYVAVRFGNVLGSRGSVVLTFKQQIAMGGPVTVTHPDMQRYFMTIPEAVQLTLQAASIGQGGEVFVLDMGEPILIADLARDLIRLSGFEVGRDIDIVYTGIRPGEKLYEELFIPGEDYHRTPHEKIFIAANARQLVPENLPILVGELESAAHSGDEIAVNRILHALIPEYRNTPLSARKQMEKVEFDSNSTRTTQVLSLDELDAAFI